MQMIQVSQKRFDELFKILTNELRIEQYQGKKCTCDSAFSERPVKNMYRHMHYHIHGFKKAIEDA